jgi:hypothetical protein
MTAAAYWDGSTAQLTTLARELLQLSPDDPDMPRLTRCADATIDAVADYLDPPVADGQAARDVIFLDGQPVVSSLTESCVLVTVEAYKRKDAPFGIAGQWSTDGLAVRVSRDWLDPVKPQLQPKRVRFGVG